MVQYTSKLEKTTLWYLVRGCFTGSDSSTDQRIKSLKTAFAKAGVVSKDKIILTEVLSVDNGQSLALLQVRASNASLKRQIDEVLGVCREISNWF